MSFLRNKRSDEERAEELFSSYIDGQVTAEERRFLERYLSGQPEARAKFELLKQAVQLTKTLPPVKAPRSFVLPRSMARKPSLALRLYPALRFATVAAMALFVFALAGDLVTSSRLAAPAAAPEMLLSSKSSATETPEQPTAEAFALQVPAPTAAPEPTLAPSDAMTDTATPAPPAASELVTPTETELAEPDESRLGALAPTPTATADQSAGVQNYASTEEPAPATPALAQFDALRAIVIALAGAAVVLGTTTLVLRRRIR
ncbi:MAG TPA: hypothetical protein VJG32_09225 [Anaerolineae bacterium]|nr:hypothetical protein [Anaerolineae bacterium]